MEDNKINREIFIIQIVNLIEVDFGETNDFYGSSIRKERGRYISQIRRKRGTLEKEWKRAFKDYIDKFNLTEIPYAEKLNSTKKKFLNFIIEDRINIELNEIFRTDINNLNIFVIPKCPSSKIYKSFILFKSDINNIESDVIKFLKKKKEIESLKGLHYSDKLHIYIDMSEEINIFKTLFNTLKLEKFNISRIKFDTKQEDFNPIQNTNILVGRDSFYLSTSGKENDLNYLIFISDYLNQIKSGERISQKD